MHEALSYGLELLVHAVLSYYAKYEYVLSITALRALSVLLAHTHTLGDDRTRA